MQAGPRIVLTGRTDCAVRRTQPKETMTVSTLTKDPQAAAPLTGQHAHEVQAFHSVIPMPIALAESTRRVSVTNLNQLLADTITLRDLYKKHHWQVSGATFYQLHLLFDKHASEQTA